MSAVVPSRRSSFRYFLFLLAAALAGSSPGLAQNKPNKAERREMKKENKDKDKDNAAPQGGKAAADDAESRTMARLREQFQVTDDAEWDVISERLTKVWEFRRNVTLGVSASRSGALGGKHSTRVGTGNQEQDSLRAAVNENLPDAEIKVRLARLKEVARQNQSLLNKAQEDLRAVLTVRQEAVAVMAGILPP